MEEIRAPLTQKQSKIPNSLTTVTKASKLLTLAMFVALPFIAFCFGLQYQKSITQNTYEFRNKQVAINPTVKPKTTTRPIPTPTPLAYKEIISDVQQVVIEKYKYSDLSGNEENPKYYLEFSFKKTTPTSKYAISGKTLIIADDSYKLSIYLPHDGGSIPFDTLPEMEVISTSQFGNLIKVKNPRDHSAGNSYKRNYINNYGYSSHLEIPCESWIPKSPACGFMQILSNVPEQSYLSIWCDEKEIGGDRKCDQIISSLSFEKLNNSN